MLYLLRSKLKKSLFGDMPTYNKNDHKAHLLSTTITIKQAESAGLVHHKAYDKVMPSGKIVHVEAKGPQAGGREQLKVGMAVKYRVPGMKKRRKGTITGESSEGWHITGQRQGYHLKGDEHMNVVAGREHIWTEKEHSADSNPKGTHVAISTHGRILKPEIVNARAKQGTERLGMTEFEVISNPAITKPAMAIVGSLARNNHIMSRYTVENGMVTNEDSEAMDIYSAYEDAMINSIRRQTALAPDEILEEFKDHLQGKRDNSRIAATIARDGKTAAIREVERNVEHYQTHREYDTSAEDDFDSGMQNISKQAATAPEIETVATSHNALESSIDHHLSMLEPTDAAIIKMKFGLGRFDKPYKDAQIAEALNSLKHPAPTGYSEWSKQLVEKQAQSALAQLAKTKSVQTLRDFLKSMCDHIDGDTLIKSHIKQYTRQDGTVVQEHDDKRVKKAPDLISHQNKHGEEIHSGAKLEHGDELIKHLRSHGWKEREVPVIRSKNGPVAGKKEDMPEHEEIKAKNRDNSALQTAERQMKKMREAAASSDDPVSVLQHMNTSRSNTYTAAIDDYREKLLNHYGHEVDRNKIATKFEKDGHAIVIGKEGDKHTVHYAGSDGKDSDKTIGPLTGKKEVESVDTGKKQPKFIMGDDDKSYTAKMNPVHSKFALVEAEDLTTSHTIQGHINKAYPQEIQPRERERLSSQMQMANIMNDIKPELFTGTGMAAHGSPIVGKDGAVESGNGRTIALIEAYKRDLAGGYKEHIAKQAAKYGLKPEDVEKMKNPVLVRVRNDDDPNKDRAEFAREANDTGNLGSSPAEQAWSDAERIDDSLLKKFTVDEDGEIYNEDNMDFINGFLDKLGKNESASLRDADGDPNKKAIERIQNAVFTKVYGSSMLTELQAESAKPKIRNVLKALNACVGDFAQVRDHDDLDVIPDMMEAIEYTLAHKDVSKAEMEHTLKNAQSLNFTGDTPAFKTDHATNMILAIADRSGSRNRLENVFRAISNEIKTEVASRENPEVDMFSGPYQPKNKEQVVKQALDKVGNDVQKAMRTAFDHTFRNYKPGVWLLRKSQMAFDFGAHDHHKAYVRTSESGTVSNIAAKGIQIGDRVHLARVNKEKYRGQHGHVLQHIKKRNSLLVALDDGSTYEAAHGNVDLAEPVADSPSKAMVASTQLSKQKRAEKRLAKQEAERLRQEAEQAALKKKQKQESRMADKFNQSMTGVPEKDMKLVLSAINRERRRFPGAFVVADYDTRIKLADAYSFNTEEAAQKWMEGHADSNSIRGLFCPGKKHVQKSLKAGVWLLWKSYHSRRDLEERGHIAFERRVQSGKISLISAKGMQKIKGRTERQNYILHKPAIEDLPSKPLAGLVLPPPAKLDQSTRDQYINTFMREFGITAGKTTTFRDSAGTELKISDRIFREGGKGPYKIFKRGRERYLPLLADTLKDPSEIWLIKTTGKSDERRYISMYHDNNGKISGYAVFHFKGNEWVGASCYQTDDMQYIDRKRTGKLIYTKKIAVAQNGSDLGSRPTEVGATASSIKLSDQNNQVNKSLAGRYLIKSVRLSDHLPIVAGDGDKFRFGVEADFNGHLAALSKSVHQSSSLYNQRRVNTSFHNNLPNELNYREGDKTPAQNDKTSHYPAGLYLLRKSIGGEHGRTDRRGKVPAQENNAGPGAGGSGRNGQEGRSESQIRKSEETHPEQAGEGSRQEKDRSGRRAGAWLIKSHIHSYTKQDGTVVAEHENKVTAHRIGPNEQLEPGTEVQIGNKRGKVLKHKVHQAHPSGSIVVHTIQLTHKRKNLYGNVHKWEEMTKPEKWEGNYSAVTTFRKSQMAFDFSRLISSNAGTNVPSNAGTNVPSNAGTNVNSHDHHVAYTRRNASGTVSQIQAKGAAPGEPEHDVYINKFKDAAKKWGASSAKERARSFSASAFLSREFGESPEAFYARKPALGKLQQWIVDGFPGMEGKQKTDPTGAATLEVRQQNAKTAFNESLQTIAGITPEQAEKVTRYYIDNKLVKIDAVNGTIRPTHGAYLDKDVILRAVEQTSEQPKPIWDTDAAVNDTRDIKRRLVAAGFSGKEWKVRQQVNRKTGDIGDANIMHKYPLDSKQVVARTQSLLDAGFDVDWMKSGNLIYPIVNSVGRQGVITIFDVERPVGQRTVGKYATQKDAEQAIAPKEPWQQTKEEFGNDEDHAGHVFRALQQGKPVPAEVKAQYPDFGYLTRDSKKHLKTKEIANHKMPDTIEINGVQRSTKNSKGQPIHATEEGVCNFWKWFGDSKVTDIQGRPLLTYHYTQHDFDEFKEQDNGRGKAFWFTASEREGSKYHICGWRRIAAYLKIEKPLDTSDQYTVEEGTWDDDIMDGIRKKKQDGITYFDKHNPDVSNPGSVRKKGETHKVTKDESQFVVFDSSQIKAVDNNGNFDSKKGHIRKSLAGVYLLRKSHIPTETVTNDHGTTFVRQEHEDVRHKFVRAANGNSHFGTISADIAAAAGIAPGKIMMKYGEHKGAHIGFGKVHIEKEHGKLMQEAGFVSAEELVQYVGENYNAIFPVKKGRIALVVEGPPQRVAVVQLSKNKKGGYWSVTTAYPPKNQKFTGTALWRGRRPSLSSSNSTQPLQPINDGHGIEMAKSSSHPSSTSGQSASGTANIPNSKNKINKSLAGTYLLKNKVGQSSYASSTLTRHLVVNPFAAVGGSFEPKSRSRFPVLGIDAKLVFPEHAGMKSASPTFIAINKSLVPLTPHNTLQTRNITSDSDKPPAQNDIRKAHVAAYDRTTKTGALAHIAAHEDSRVKRYEIKLGRTKNSAEVHKLRMERFAHLPHWGSLDEHTKQAILDAEDEKHAEHKSFEEWVDKRKNPSRTDAPGNDKIDRSGWEQSRLFKARRKGLFLIRKR